MLVASAKSARPPAAASARARARPTFAARVEALLSFLSPLRSLYMISLITTLPKVWAGAGVTNDAGVGVGVSVVTVDSSVCANADDASASAQTHARQAREIARCAPNRCKAAIPRSERARAGASARAFGGTKRITGVFRRRGKPRLVNCRSFSFSSVRFDRFLSLKHTTLECGTSLMFTERPSFQRSRPITPKHSAGQFFSLSRCAARLIRAKGLKAVPNPRAHTRTSQTSNDVCYLLCPVPLSRGREGAF